MNATTRVLTQDEVAQKQWLALASLRSRLTLLLVLIFISALGVVYNKDLNRRLFINYQELQQVNQQLNAYHNDLLLETGTWSAQTRIQTVSEQQLNMKMPIAKDIIIVKYT